jgi:hypothetical protein
MATLYFLISSFAIFSISVVLPLFDGPVKATATLLCILLVSFSRFYTPAPKDCLGVSSGVLYKKDYT